MRIVKDKKTIAEIYFLTDNKEIKNSGVINLIRDCLLKCYSEIPLSNKKIAVYPSDDDFVKNKMGGVTGNAMYKNVITLYINPVAGWKKYLQETLVHEYTHLAVKDIHNWRTLLDSLIFEGIAEVFRDEIIGGKPSFWATALTKNQSKVLFKKLKSKLKTSKKVIYDDLFFGSEEYERWSGYSLGYYIVKDFRMKYPEMAWKEIIKLKPAEILKKSRFNS